MQTSQAGLDLITEFEGYHRKLPNGDCTTYICPAGVLTLGFGCTHGITEGMVWTRQQAQDAFRSELAKFEAAVNRLVTVAINQHQFDAMVALAYNIGEGGLQQSSVLRLTNAGDFAGAAKGFPLWNKSRLGGPHKPLVVTPGLVRRRAAEAALYLRPAPEESSQPMPQRVEMGALEAHAELGDTSWTYSMVGRGLQALRWIGLGTAGGTVAKKAIEGGQAPPANVTPVAVDLLGQVGAMSALILQHGIPLLLIALVGVLALEVIREIQRRYVMGVKA